MLKSQYFGIEIEMTGATRNEVASAIARFFGTTYNYIGGPYDAYQIIDGNGRTWKVVSDASIRPERASQLSNGKFGYTPCSEMQRRVELVSPKLRYEDIERLQELVREIRKTGAKANTSCGIHIHVDAANHTGQSLKNLLMIMYSKEDLLYKALQVHPTREANYCRKVKDTMIQRVQGCKVLSLDQLKDFWYDGQTYRASQHYDNSRYAALNLHNVWFRGTVEFRLFNGTMHAGKIKAYIHLCLAISAQAIEQKRARAEKTQTGNDKFTFRTWLLRLGMIGDEFKNTREHLLANLEGDSAWRYDKNTYPANQRVAV